jgi:hypothetical protein
MKKVQARYKERNQLFFTADNGENIKKGVFSNCPILAVNADPFLAHGIMEDFTYHTGYQSSTA